MDPLLLTLLQNGDKTAFAQAIQQLQNPLFSYLGRMGLEQAVAEEIAQETFIRAWQARERFDAQKSVYSTWLFTIARRLALNELDRSWRRHEQSDNDTVQLTAEPDCRATPAERLHNQALQARLNAALKVLPAHERSLLALAYINELELADIARIEDIPTGTVKSRLHRIRSKLKDMIGDPEL